MTALVLLASLSFGDCTSSHPEYMRVRGKFIRGDANNDGVVNVSDGQYILNWLFQGGPPPPCNMDAADTNDDGVINGTDANYIFNYLFQGGPPPAAPFPQPGCDCTEDYIAITTSPQPGERDWVDAPEFSGLTWGYSSPMTLSPWDYHFGHPGSYGVGLWSTNFDSSDSPGCAEGNRIWNVELRFNVDDTYGIYAKMSQECKKPVTKVDWRHRFATGYPCKDENGNCKPGTNEMLIKWFGGAVSYLFRYTTPDGSQFEELLPNTGQYCPAPELSRVTYQQTGSSCAFQSTSGEPGPWFRFSQTWNDGLHYGAVPLIGTGFDLHYRILKVYVRIPWIEFQIPQDGEDLSYWEGIDPDLFSELSYSSYWIDVLFYDWKCN
jgi:hypothetical protein